MRRPGVRHGGRRALAAHVAQHLRDIRLAHELPPEVGFHALEVVLGVVEHRRDRDGGHRAEVPQPLLRVLLPAFHVLVEHEGVEGAHEVDHVGRGRGQRGEVRRERRVAVADDLSQEHVMVAAPSALRVEDLFAKLGVAEEYHLFDDRSAGWREMVGCKGGHLDVKVGDVRVGEEPNASRKSMQAFDAFL